ncbi:peptide deformylase [Dermabacter sp. p3-SID358]|uniref:peptide deformylase n=1 Tax=Dermabacter sp. p3-SID358 TaxID=2916114 RepID=UPI0021A5D622|nr:peptide deformylase [Dermabacter sp. p3-SID358]MCT1867387.1 peptide deformylase [Dermabacter sp. p3-SID358]
MTSLAELIEKTLAKRGSESEPLRIVQAGHPALRARSKNAARLLDPELLSAFIDALVVTMHEAPGVGVAAPQVGVPIRLVVMEDRVHEEGEERDADDDRYERDNLPLMAVINPRYEEVEGEDTVTFGWEGCLSVDGWRSLVPRPKSVRVFGTAILADGEVRELDEEWTGWSARIFQHESDHLDGILCHDRGVDRSFVQDSYLHRYTDLSDAVRYLGLRGDVVNLEPGAVDLHRTRA